MATQEEKTAAKASRDAAKAAKIQNAVAVATEGDEATQVSVPEVIEILPPYVFGEPVEAGMKNSIEEGIVYNVDPAFVSVKRGYNSRNFESLVNKERVEEMARSIEANGQSTAIKVAIESLDGEHRMVIVSGETRLRAILKLRENHGAARFSTVKVLLAEAKTEIEREIEQVTDNTADRFTPLEMLNTMQKLRALGMTKNAEVTRRLNISHTMGRNLEILAWATPAIRATIDDGFLSASYVIEALRPTEGKAEEIVKVEKRLVRMAQKKAEEGKTSSKGTRNEDPDDEGGDDGRSARGKNGLFNRVSYNGLVSVCREILDTLEDPTDLFERAGITTKADQEALFAALDSKISNGLRNVFESCEIPREAPEVTEAKAKAQKESDKAKAVAEKQADAEAKGAAKAAEALAKAEAKVAEANVAVEAAKAKALAKA